jgi:hypothetical protein
MLQLRVNHTANNRGCSKWKEARAAAAKRAQGERGQKDGVSSRVPAHKSAPARPSPEHKKLGPGWNHVVRGARVVKSEATKEPTPNPSGAAGQTRGRAPQQWASPNPVVPGRQWYFLSHPSPNTLTPLPVNHRVSHHSRGSPTSSTIFPPRPA